MIEERRPTRATIHRDGGFNGSWTNPRFNHAAARFAKTIVPNWDDCYSFTFIRNPYDRMVSWYTWNKHPDPFPDWLENVFCKNVTDGLWPPIGIDFFAFEEGEQLVTEILRVEDLPEEWPRLVEKLKLKPGVIQRRKKSRHKHYREYHTPSTRKIVEKMMASDFELGGYDF
tara:strand:+ start:3745 stop:4257 length:513 start_codon:yes stop_codon:yes gene_type:complete